MILTIAGGKYYWHNQLVTHNFRLTGSCRRSSSPMSDYDADDDDDDDDDYQPSEESVQSVYEQEYDSSASVSSASQSSSTGSIVLRF